MTSRAEHNESPTTYSYHPDGQVEEVVEPNGLTTEYAYDPDTGELSTQRVLDAFAAYTTTYAYDTAGDLAQMTVPGVADGTTPGLNDTPDQVLEYLRQPGEMGRVDQTVLDPGGLERVTAFGYDEDGRTTTRQTDPAGLDLTSTTAYDPTGRVIESLNPAGFGPTTTHDALFGDLEEVTQPVSSGVDIVSTYTYDDTGRVEDTIVDGSVISRTTYDQGRLHRTHLDPRRRHRRDLRQPRSAMTPPAARSPPPLTLTAWT